MATPPTFVASYGNSTIGKATQTASVTVAAGDLVIVKAGTNDASANLNPPTGGGLTYALQQAVTGVTQQSNAYIWTAISSVAQTFTLTLSPASTAINFTWSVEVWRNHGGVGTSAKKTATATTSLSVTPQGANSALSVLNVDRNAVDGTTRTFLTSAGAFTQDAYQRLTGTNALGFYSGYHADAGVVGAKTVGMSAPTGQRPSLLVVEVLAAPPAATGSLSITATALSSNTPPAVRIDVNDTRSPGQASALTIMRVNPDGTQTVVRTADGNPLALSGGVGLVFDYEMALGAAVAYTALEAPGITSPQVTVTSSQVWLVHPGIPSLSVPITLRKGSLAQTTRPVTRGTFWPMGRAYPVIVTDGSRKAPQSQLLVEVDTVTDETSLTDLLADASALLLNVPSSLALGWDSSYVSIGDVTVDRLTDIGTDPYRVVTLPFTVVDRPAGGSQSLRTYVDVLAGYGSYAAVQAQYRSYVDLLAGP